MEQDSREELARLCERATAFGSRDEFLAVVHDEIETQVFLLHVNGMWPELLSEFEAHDLKDPNMKWQVSDLGTEAEVEALRAMHRGYPEIHVW
ncbi:hypothetical protein SynBIOSE41_01482 [Synechococcus sp. BIOS-E4-1]|nr:hypothetical protein SynBIOSE41_01482 [Synechococcus sp. BIOS-E4-1]